MARKLYTNTRIPIEVQRQIKQLHQWAQEDEGRIARLETANSPTSQNEAGGLSQQDQATTSLLSGKLNTLVNFRGTWNATTAYNVNDLVVFSGRGFIALKPNTNVSTATATTWVGL